MIFEFLHNYNNLNGNIVNIGGGVTSDTPPNIESLVKLNNSTTCFSNYRACSCLVMKSLNPSRYCVLLKHWFRDGTVLNPEQANCEEPFILGKLLFIVIDY